MQNKEYEMNWSRRRFIQSAGAAGILAGLPSVLKAMPTASGTGKLTILQTTDVHCQIHPHDELFWENEKTVFRTTGGYAHLATLFEQIKKENPNTFIVDTGDMFQGSELSVKTLGNAMVPILNALPYDLYLPGNWEVIYYKKSMERLLGSLNAPTVCANMFHDAGEGKRGERIFKPYHIWEVNGIKVAFLGYTDPLVPIRQSPAYSKGIAYSKPEEDIVKFVKELKDEQKCSYIVVLSHLGLSQQLALANREECKGVNVIFGGDTHERVRKPIQCTYSKVVEPGAFGSFVGRLDLEFKDGLLINEKYELIEVDSKKYPAKKDVARVIALNEKPMSDYIYNVIGYSSIPLYRYFVIENPIDTMITDALMWKVKPDIALSNGFRFCPPRLPGEDGKVAITEGYLYDMLPVDSTVKTAKVSGKQIADWLERELENVFASDASKRMGGWVIRFKGMEMTFKAYEAFGKRVQKITVGGNPIDLDAVYTICACEREGDPETMLCRIRDVKEPKNTDFTLHSMMKEYLRKFPVVTPEPKGNAIALDAPKTLLTQVYGVDYKFV